MILQYLPSLTHIAVCDADSELVQSLALFCPRLTALCLEGSNINDDIVVHLCSMRRLQSLSLGECPGLSPFSFAELLRNLPDLRSLGKVSPNIIYKYFWAIWRLLSLGGQNLCSLLNFSHFSYIDCIEPSCCTLRLLKKTRVLQSVKKTRVLQSVGRRIFPMCPCCCLCWWGDPCVLWSVSWSHTKWKLKTNLLCLLQSVYFLGVRGVDFVYAACCWLLSTVTGWLLLL